MLYTSSDRSRSMIMLATPESMGKRRKYSSGYLQARRVVPRRPHTHPREVTSTHLLLLGFLRPSIPFCLFRNALWLRSVESNNSNNVLLGHGLPGHVARAAHQPRDVLHVVQRRLTLVADETMKQTRNEENERGGGGGGGGKKKSNNQGDAWWLCGGSELEGTVAVQVRRAFRVDRKKPATRAQTPHAPPRRAST